MLGNGAFAVVRLGSKIEYKSSATCGSDNKNNTNFGHTSRYIDSRYAIKMMKRSYIDVNKIYRGLLQNEIQILRELSHPNIMKVHDLLEDENHYYVVSEYLKGGSVMKRLREHGRPYTEWTTFLIVK